VKIVQDEFAAKRGLMLPEIFQLDRRAHLRNEPYGWCWAAAAFLDGHPRYREPFRKLKADAATTDDRFSRHFLAALANDAKYLAEDWQVFVAEIDYGYDLERSAVRRKPAESLVNVPQEGITVKIDAAAGWQSSGVRVRAGDSYSIAASGRYHVGDKPKPWICEPAGVSIEYHRGLPLGILMAAVGEDDASGDKLTGLVAGQPVGSRRDGVWEASGVVYFRINEASAGLKDNRGVVTIVMRPSAITDQAPAKVQP
jgi:hypothetical protein